MVINVLEFCDFESGDTCTWQSVDPVHQIKSDQETKLAESANIATTNPLRNIDAIWIVNSPSIRFTNPPTDHTLKNKFGNYLILFNQNLKSGHEDNYWATLMSDRYDLQQTNGLCLEFYYYIHNEKSNDGQIIVWKSESIDKIDKITNLTKTNQWTRAKLSLKPNNLQSTNMFIYIQGGTSKGNGFIAIDDVAVKKSVCNQTQDNTFFWCNSNTKINITKVCDFVKDCPDGKDELNCGNCDFENGDCGYTKVIKYEPNEFSWRIGNSQVGPKFGYSNSHGFVYASRLKGFDSVIPLSAILYSPTIQSCSLGGIISFAYYLSSDKVSLKLLFLLYEDGLVSDKVVLWESHYEKNYKIATYNMKTVNLIRRKVQFKIGFQAEIDMSAMNSSSDFVALDQIKISSCEPPKKSTSCNAKAQFKCKNEVCVDLNEVCDFNDNCNDGSDEMNCDKNLMSSFEDGLEDWNIKNKNASLWLISNGFRSAVDGPTYDHTIRLEQGHYLAYIYSLNSKTFADGTVLGPTFKSGAQCQMRLFISIEGNFNGKFMIGIKNTKINTQLTLKTYDKPFNNYFWLNDSLKLSSPNEWSEFQVYLFADIKSNDKSSSYIAIDDVSFRNCIKVNTINTPPPFTTSTIKPQTRSKGNLI